MDAAFSKTTDGGKTFTQLGTLNHLDGVTVDFTDPERKTIVFAQHEKSRSLMISKDGGATWSDIGKNLPENTRFTTWPLLLNSKVIITNTSGWGGGKITGIFRSEDAGETWTKVSELSPGGFPLLTSKGDIFYPAWERFRAQLGCRKNVDAREIPGRKFHHRAPRWQPRRRGQRLPANLEGQRRDMGCLRPSDPRRPHPLGPTPDTSPTCPA